MFLTTLDENMINKAFEGGSHERAEFSVRSGRAWLGSIQA